VIYGAFAAIPIFLMWLYLSWVVILIGALIAATLPDLKPSPAQSG
jgi:membrane protein